MFPWIMGCFGCMQCDLVGIYPIFHQNSHLKFRAIKVEAITERQEMGTGDQAQARLREELTREWTELMKSSQKNDLGEKAEEICSRLTDLEKILMARRERVLMGEQGLKEGDAGSSHADTVLATSVPFVSNACANLIIRVDALVS